METYTLGSRTFLLAKKYPIESSLNIKQKGYIFVGKRTSTLPIFKAQLAAATVAKSLQSCPTLCDPIDGSPSGSSTPGILQARTLEWGAIAFSKAHLKPHEKDASNF